MKHPRLSAIFIAASAATLLMASTAGFAGHKAAHKAAPAQDSYKGENFKAEVPAPCPPVMMLHDGFYIGVGVGYDSFRVHHTSETYTTDATDVPPVTVFTNTSLNHAANGWMGGLFAGYGRYFDTFYIGAEINANASNADTTWSTTDSVYGGSSINLKARGSYGIALLPGIKLNDSSLLYVRLGYLRSEFKANETLTNSFNLGLNGSASSNEWRNGFNYGVGIETYAAENVSIRGEFTHTQYNNKTITQNLAYTTPTTGTITRTSKIEPSNNEFMLSLLYHFA